MQKNYPPHPANFQNQNLLGNGIPITDTNMGAPLALRKGSFAE